MTDRIVQLSGEDFEAAMDFLNSVFGAHAPHDFEGLLPSIYRRTDEHLACNYAVRRDGALKAVVGMFPINWQVAEVTLRVAGIGGFVGQCVNASTSLPGSFPLGARSVGQVAGPHPSAR